MTKLLTGRELYIAKHIRGQLLSEDIKTPSKKPPQAIIDICINLRTIGGQLVDTQLLYISEYSPPNRSWQGIRFAPASFLFKNLPEEINNACVTAPESEGTPVTGQFLYLYWSFQNLHYCDLVFGYWVKTGKDTPFPPPTTYPVGWKTDHTTLTGDTYAFDVTDNKGHFQISITPTYTPGIYNNWTHICSAWDIPFRSYIQVDYLTGYPHGTIFKISRDMYGFYHVEIDYFGVT